MNFGEHQLVQRIKERFAMPEFVTLANVQTPAGTFADAIALNLWRSRGYELIGFEVKSVRGDWLREKKNPAKAEGVAQFCKTFWIVANEGVVKLEELPHGWGLFEPQGKGLIQRQKALPLDHSRELTVPFMVNIVRRAVEKGEMIEELNAAREAGRQAGIEEQARRGTDRDIHDKLERFTALHAEFKARTGIEIRDWMGGKELAVVWELSRNLVGIENQISFAASTLPRVGRDLNDIMRKLKEARNGANHEV